MEFLEQIKNLKKNNKPVYTADDLNLFVEFQSLGENDFMEQKSITRLGKLLDRAVLLVCPKKVVGFNMPLYLISFRTDRFEKELSRHTVNASEEVLLYVKDLLEFGKVLSPIADKWHTVYSKQWMRNGKIPKKFQNAVSAQVYASTDDCSELNGIILDVASELEVRILAYYSEAKNSGKLIAGVTAEAIRAFENGKYTTVLKELSENEKDKNITKIVSNNKLTLINRLSTKIGNIGLKSKIVEKSFVVKNKNCFEIYVKLENGDKFEVVGKSVINFSPLGNMFVQFPITFRNMVSCGKKIENSENKFREAFSN
jgi:hypothetical protein